jgi:hypothetical protein
MRSRSRTIYGLRSRVGALGVGLVLVLGVGGCGSSGSSQSGPSDVVKQFYDAAGAGDGKTACPLLTAQERSKAATGTTCERGLRTLGALLAPQLKGLKVGKARVQGDRATVVVSTPRKTTTVELQRVGGKWVISSLSAGGSRTSQGSASSGAGSQGPSKAQVDAVAKCLKKPFGLISNAGLDTTYGQPHVVLSVSPGKSFSDSYRVEVFASPAAAKAALPQVQAYFAKTKGPVKLSGSTIVAAESAKADPSALPKIEACL